MIEFFDILSNIEKNGHEKTEKIIKEQLENLNKLFFFTLTQKIAKNIQRKVQEVNFSFSIKFLLIQQNARDPAFSCILTDSSSNKLYQDTIEHNDFHHLNIEKFFDHEMSHLNEISFTPFLKQHDFLITFNPNENNADKFLQNILTPDLFSIYLKYKMNQIIDLKNTHSIQSKI